MHDGKTIERYAGDTLEFRAQLKTAKLITADQWADADLTLIMVDNGTMMLVDCAGVLTLDLDSAELEDPNIPEAVFQDGVMPPAGSYLFRITSDFTDGSKFTFPDQLPWNVLRVAAGPSA